MSISSTLMLKRKRGCRELACLFRFEPQRMIFYSDFVECCSKYAYPGTVKTVPYEHFRTQFLKLIIYENILIKKGAKNMKYEWIDGYLLNKKGVTKDFKEEWNWIRYFIGGKMFAAICLDDDTNLPYYITLKLEPVEGEFLRQQYEDIIPGYYMNKVHWNSINPDGNVPDELMRELLDKSYDLVLHGLSKKLQKEILGL